MRRGSLHENGNNAVHESESSPHHQQREEKCTNGVDDLPLWVVPDDGSGQGHTSTLDEVRNHVHVSSLQVEVPGGLYSVVHMSACMVVTSMIVIVVFRMSVCVAVVMSVSLLKTISVDLGTAIGVKFLLGDQRCLLISMRVILICLVTMAAVTMLVTMAVFVRVVMCVRRQ